MDNRSRADRVTTLPLSLGVDHSCILDQSLYPLYQARIAYSMICDAVPKYLYSAFSCVCFLFSLYRRTKRSLILPNNQQNFIKS